MVSLPPRSQSPTHELAKRLHERLTKPTDVELKTALKLQDASACGNFVVADVQDIATVIGSTRAQVMRSIKRMRTLRLIAVEFCSPNERITAVIAETKMDKSLNDFVLELINAFETGIDYGPFGGGTAAA